MRKHKVISTVCFLENEKKKFAFFFLFHRLIFKLRKQYWMKVTFSEIVKKQNSDHLFCYQKDIFLWKNKLKKRNVFFFEIQIENSPVI